MSLKDNLRKLRKERDLTQKELGDILNIPFRTIMNWERGIREPSSQNMVMLEKFFNVPGEVLRGEISLEDYNKKSDYYTKTPDVLEKQLQEYMKKYAESDYLNQTISTRLLTTALKALRFFILGNEEIKEYQIDNLLETMDSLDTLNKDGMMEVFKRINELARLDEYTKDGSTATKKDPK